MGGELCEELWGSVLIMKSVSNDNNWEPHVALSGGGGFGSYFGASLESVDINNDGLDDLIVGAPFESGTKAGQTDEAEDAGCIYVYSQLVCILERKEGLN